MASMTQPRPDPAGRTFMLPDATYNQYLNALGDGWIEATNLEQSLSKALESLSQVRTRWVRNFQTAHDSTVSAIIDIRPKQIGNGNTVTVAAHLPKSYMQGHHKGTINVDATDYFINVLRNCNTDVHTRIVICQDSLQSSTQHERPIEALFFSQILGCELDLTPAYVCQLSQRRDIQELSRTRRYENSKIMDTCVQFQMSQGKCDNVAIYIGRKQLGNGSPHIVVVSLQYLHPDLGKADSKPSGEILLEPPSPSTWGRNYPSSQPSGQYIGHRKCTVPQPPFQPEPAHCFLDAVSRSLSEASPLQASTIAGSWLSALIHMQVLSYAKALDSIIDPLNYENDDRVVELSRVCSSLGSSRGHIIRIQEHLVDIRRSDYAEAFRRLEQILDEARTHKMAIDELLNNRFRIKSIDAAELTVRRSRFAVALTVLTFIFIPVNLASSIFGMNVQQINKTGHSVKLFVYTSIALLLLSATGFYLRHVLMSALKLMRKLATSVLSMIVKPILLVLAFIDMRKLARSVVSRIVEAILFVFALIDRVCRIISRVLRTWN